MSIRSTIHSMLQRIDAFVGRNIQNVVTAMVQIYAGKVRALLTTLGIIIAVTSTITVVSLVEGFGSYVTDMLRGFGTNLVFVLPYRPPGDSGASVSRVVLDGDDIRAVVGRCDKIRRISPLVFLGGSMEYGREKIEAGEIELRGCTEQFQSIRKFAVDHGRFFGPIDVDQGAYVCVVGREVLRLLGCDTSVVGDYVYINELRFKVLGVLEPRGNLMDEDQDRFVLIPYTTAIKLSPFSRQYLPFMAEATSEADVQEGVLQMTRVLRDRHQLTAGQPNDFRILRQDEFLRNFEQVKVVATAVLSGIVGISLIVGGIGIMNVMMVSVTERTREIGLRKSVGGRRRDILLQFLTEAMLLSIIGGLVGIALGYGLCWLASLHPSMVEIRVPLWTVLLALGFSAAVGVVFGMIPAFKAAILPPIDALRHE